MNALLRFVFAITAALTPGMACAEDRTPCPAGMICASDPDGVLNAVRAAGYAARTTDGSGDSPAIRLTASGLQYDIQFYDCKDRRLCASLQFVLVINDDGSHSAQAVNDWNAKRNFAQMAQLKDGDYRLSYDISTVGGVTPAHFRSVLRIWRLVLRDLDHFMQPT